MNIIHATVQAIEQFDNISAVYFDAFGVTMRMVSLELNKNIQVGASVLIGAKATNVSLAKTMQKDISISNQIKGVVESVAYGTILCSVKVRVEDTLIESIITQKSATKMDIKAADSIVVLLKATDVSILSLQEKGSI